MRARLQVRLEERHMERERIARELHDALLQGFQGLVLTFDATMRRIAPGEPRDTLERALDRAQETLTEGRDRVQDLRNSGAFHGDLPTALEDAAADLAIANLATCTPAARRPGEVIGHGVPGHWGMTGMRERAQKLGARLFIRSSAGSGTEVELAVPSEVAYVR